MGAGVSELRLEIDSPSRYDPQHVLAVAAPTSADGFTRGVVVRDLTLNGNYKNIDWSDTYGDGNAFGTGHPRRRRFDLHRPGNQELLDRWYLCRFDTQ